MEEVQTELLQMRKSCAACEQFLDEIRELLSGIKPQGAYIVPTIALRDWRGHNDEQHESKLDFLLRRAGLY